MTDYTKLIERLREIVGVQGFPTDDLVDAADAIEALQEENALLEGTLESRERNIAEMQAENERLNKNNGLIYVEVLQLRNERDALQSKVNAMGKGEPVGYFEKNSFGIWWNVSPANQDIQGVVPLYAAPKALPSLTDTYVQQVPDKCDRITWRGRYYHLPIAAPKALAPSREVIGRYMADKGFYLSKEALDGLMLKLEGIGGTQ